MAADVQGALSDASVSWTRRVRTRYLIEPTTQPRVRRAGDLTALVIGLLLIWLTWLSFNDMNDVNASALEFAELFPTWSQGVFKLLFALGALYALALLVIAAVQGRRRTDLLRDLALALGLVVLATLIVARMTSGEWPQILPELGAAGLPPQYPMLRIGVVTAVGLAVSPHATLPLRRLTFLIVALTAFSGAALGYGLISSAIAAAAFGLVAAKLVLVVFGSPDGYPDIETVRSALADLGVSLDDLEFMKDQSWGVRRLVGTSSEHARVEVKVYGRDATDSQIAARVWRYLWYREGRSSLMVTANQQMEHDSLLTVFAERSVAPTARFLVSGMAGDDLAVLAVAQPGTAPSAESLRSAEPEQLADLWRSLRSIHDVSISHGAMDLTALTQTKDGFVLGNLGAGQLSATRPVQMVDYASLLFSLANAIGVEDAVRSAKQGLGADGLAELLPYVQVPAVTAKARKEAEDPGDLIDELREELGRVADVDPGEKIELRRISPRRLIISGFSLVAVYFLITQLAKIDFASVWEELQGANWVWIVLAFLFAQLMYLPEATSMLATVGQPIPLRPLVILQSASKFAGLALSSTAGRVTINTAFLRKYGVNLTQSVAQSAVESIGGLVVEATILITAFLVADVSLDIDLSGINWWLIILIVVGLSAGVSAFVARSERMREVVLPALKTAWASFSDVLRDPRRTVGLFGSNLVSRIILSIALLMILTGLGEPMGLASLLVAVVASSLLAGVIPVPGGVGVTEAVITAVLVFLGVTESVAFAAAVVYRVTTYYIPAGAGFFSMQWLDRNGHI